MPPLTGLPWKSQRFIRTVPLENASKRFHARQGNPVPGATCLLVRDTLLGRPSFCLVSGSWRVTSANRGEKTEKNVELQNYHHGKLFRRYITYQWHLLNEMTNKVQNSFPRSGKAAPSRTREKKLNFRPKPFVLSSISVFCA